MADKTHKLPAIQFYPGDWKKDVGVQSLSFHDRGVWFEMLLLMHESERRGVLLLNGRPISDESLARLLGLDKQTLTTALTNILEAGVVSREEETGALMSRRMVKDEKLRRVRAEAGKSGGNPALLIGKDKHPPKQTGEQTPTPSPSVSASTTEPARAAGGAFFDHSMVSRAVMTECSLSGKDLSLVLAEVAKAEIGKGADGLALVVKMQDRWREYSAIPATDLEFKWGARTFFGEGYWDNKAAWPWKEGKSAGQRKRVYLT